MTYLLKRNNHYYYNRRVPDIFRDLDKRDTVRVSLQTDSRKLALRKAIMLNDQVEAYWQSLSNGVQLHSNSSFRQTARIARQLGFTYQPLSVVANLPLPELIGRVLAANDATPKQIEALLGGKDEPTLLLNKVLDKFWELSKDKITGKSPQQLRKWRVPRIRVMKQFIEVVGDKVLKDVDKDDIIAYRDWWLERVQTDGMNSASANKDLVMLKGILDIFSDHFKAGLEIPHLFKRIKLKTRFKQQRLPFTNEQIISLLANKKLENMLPELRWFLFAASETGARPSEIAGLEPEDIRLDHPIPHISITDRPNRPLKTPHSERVIPLVGYSLEAFQACPIGFPRYRG